MITRADLDASLDAMANYAGEPDGWYPRKAMIKYCLFPGHVTSRIDGQRHYIPARDLAELYGVDMRECTVYYEPLPSHLNPNSTRYINLYPRSNGDYTLPNA